MGAVLWAVMVVSIAFPIRALDDMCEKMGGRLIMGQMHAVTPSVKGMWMDSRRNKGHFPVAVCYQKKPEPSND